MLYRAELTSLRKHQDFPSVSIFAPMHRTAPANKKDPIKVDNLVRQAIERLHGEVSKRESATVVKQLRQVVKEIDWEHALDGIALFASREHYASVSLPFKVKPRVVVDESFATRELAYAINRATPYRVLAVSHSVRLFDAWTNVLEEHLQKPFPLQYRAGGGKKLSRRQVMRRTDARGDDQRKFFREVDAAVAAVQKGNPLPLIVTGVERNLAYYCEATKHADLIRGMLAGNHDRTPPDQLGKLVWPVFEVAATKQRADALVKLDDAVGAGRHVSGIEQVWQASARGNCRTLLVENEFAFPAELSADGQQLLPYTGQGAANLDDAVDEIIDRVKEQGGEVFFYSAGDLAAHDGIAAIVKSKS